MRNIATQFIHVRFVCCTVYDRSYSFFLRHLREKQKKRKKYITSSGILIKKLFIIILLLFCCFCVALVARSLPFTSGTCNKIMVHEYLSKDYKWTSKILATTFTKGGQNEAPRKKIAFHQTFLIPICINVRSMVPYDEKKVLLAH